MSTSTELTALKICTVGSKRKIILNKPCEVLAGLYDRSEISFFRQHSDLHLMVYFFVIETFIWSASVKGVMKLEKLLYEI